MFWLYGCVEIAAATGQLQAVPEGQFVMPGS
jgi:hypothetical protein